jgi:AcrR family transcriptional regulator
MAKRSAKAKAAGREQPSRKPREKLSKGRIEETAAALIERDGLENFSTRKLAGELGCEAMSIYHYFPSRAHLMDALVDRALGSMVMPPADLSWREKVRRVAYEYRAMAHRSPRFFQFMVLHRLNTPTGLGVLNRIIAIFRDGGFDLEQSARFFRVLGYYLSGAALDETSGYAKGPSAAEPVADEVAARDYPDIAAINPYFKPAHHEATFALGLDMLLEGMAAAAPKARPAAGEIRRGGGRPLPSSRRSSR